MVDNKDIYDLGKCLMMFVVMRDMYVICDGCNWPNSKIDFYKGAELKTSEKSGWV